MESDAASGSTVQPPIALLPTYYTDPVLADAEQQRIFARTWQLVGHLSDLPDAGSRIVGRAGDQEVLVVKDEDGKLHAHRNVCRHRGARLVDGPSRADAIRCPYHGWTYHHDGSLVGAPESRRIPCFDKAKLGLLPVRIETFHGLVFVNLDPDAAPLADQLAGLSDLIGRYLPDDLVPFGKYRMHDLAGSEVHHANWKIIVDNYLEGYHVPVAHPGLMRLLDYQNYTAEVFPGYVFYEVPLREAPSSNFGERLYQRTVEPMPGLAEADRRIWRFVAIYPNTLIDLTPDQVGVWSVVPKTVTSSYLPGASYRAPHANLRTRLAQLLNLKIAVITADEDADVVASVQQGATTPGYEFGPLSSREIGVGWFADRIRAELAGAVGADGAADRGDIGRRPADAAVAVDAPGPSDEAKVLTSSDITAPSVPEYS
jgi:choline monooxygenase